MDYIAFGFIAIVMIAILIYLLKNNREPANDNTPYTSFDPLLGIQRDDFETHQEVRQDSKHQPPYVEPKEKLKQNKGSRP
jgi:hypothetical protein